MAKDMFATMLDSFVNSIFTNIGKTKEEVHEGVQQFMDLSATVGETLNRIEQNQLLLIEAENERRRDSGRDPIGYVSNGGSLSYRRGDN